LFRSTFDQKVLPKVATLYVAGPSSATIYLNGVQVGQFVRDINAGIRPVVFTVALTGLLRKGANVLAVEAHPLHNPSYMPLEYMLVRGQYLIAKIVPAAEGIDAPPIEFSDTDWRATASPANNWQATDFDDSQWPHVRSLGAMDGDIDKYQWNADGGLYRWPGYSGIAPYLRHLSMNAEKVIDPIEANAHFDHLEDLSRTGTFSLQIGSSGYDPSQPASLVLDFGREINGRLRVEIAGSSSLKLLMQYGESLEEAVKKPYLGALPLTALPGVAAYSQKTAFRYVKVIFLAGPQKSRVTLSADAIYYPVTYTGSFESSDPQLNHIWEVGAYTAHLCMQDSIWDAPKRDRGRWMGDLDVSGRVIETAFDDRFLMEDTIRRLNDFPTGAQKDVNGIPGYSAMWVMGLADYYRHSGAKDFLLAEKAALIALLARMRNDLDADGLFSAKGGAWPFVDWSRDLVGPTAEAIRGTDLEYYRAFAEGAYLLRETGSTAEAEMSEQTAARMRETASKHLVDPATGTFGDRWQINAMAIYSGLATEQQKKAIRERIFSRIDVGNLPDDDVSPYYGSYVLDAMAQVGDRAGALTFMREWWGGMLNEGATSFWEGYDPRWPKENFHANLKADGAQGYFVSLAHGWSAGPTAWLTEQLLGIQPLAAGFDKLLLRPDLPGLTYIRGTEATPHGIIRVDARRDSGLTVTFDLPSGIEAMVSLPVSSVNANVTVDGVPMDSSFAEEQTRRVFTLSHGGHYVLHAD
jgi:hypothetical protein